MKTMFLLTNCWPNSTMHNDAASMGMVTEDEAVAKDWVKEDGDNGYEAVFVVTDPSEFKDAMELWNAERHASVDEVQDKTVRNFLDSTGGA